MLYHEVKSSLYSSLTYLIYKNPTEREYHDAVSFNNPMVPNCARACIYEGDIYVWSNDLLHMEAYRCIGENPVYADERVGKVILLELDNYDHYLSRCKHYLDKLSCVEV